MSPDTAAAYSAPRTTPTPAVPGGPAVDRVDTGAPHGSDGVPTATPELTWTTRTVIPGWRQASAELSIERPSGTERATVDGDASVAVPWPFGPLAPREVATLRVRTTGTGGETSPWSAPRTVRGSFLADGEWVARPIGLPAPDGPAQPALARTEVTVAGGLRAATLYGTARGVYQVAVDGLDVDDAVMKPGWTPYDLRLVHETTDVTALLTEGTHVLGVRFAGAWATERFGFREGADRVYEEQPRVAVQLVLEYADGRREVVATDGSWRTSTGPLVASGLYAGESYDARLADDAWTRPGFDDSAWAPAAVGDALVVPAARTGPAVRRIETVAVREVLRSPSGATLLDFGLNLVGRLRITVEGPRGTTITLRHAEVLEHGELGTRPLRAAAATDTYVLAGDGPEVWEPEFTFHGFRFAQVDGWPGELDPADVVAVVVHSDMERTGWWTSSHPLVDQLHENVVTSMRGNFLALPTDCPQRDERLGWTGDIQVFAPTAAFLYDCRTFLGSWLEDLTLEQRVGGGVVPFVVPNVLGPARPAAAWGDAATVVPTVLHERYGDLEVVRRQYPSMVDWVDVLLDLAGDRFLWEGHFQFADWLDPDAPPDRPADAKTDPDVVASAYLFRSTDLVARSARLLGRDEDAQRYGAVAEQVRSAFLAEYVTPAGRMVSDAQTAYALAITFEIAPPEQHAALGARLAELTRRSGYRIGTGFVGTPIIADALTRTGHVDVAARLLTQTECPSWLYPVTMGATTIWERWDSMLPDGSINPGQMTSFNHYALGAIADWLHRVVAGLAPAAPGYRRLRVEPHPLPGFDHASARHRTPYGEAAVGWRRTDGDEIEVHAVVPPNTTAEVHLPGRADVLEVGSGEHRWTVPPTGRDGSAAAAPARAPLSLESSLATVVDDPEAYDALFEVLRAMDPAVAEDVRAHTVWLERRPLGEALDRHVPVPVRRQIAERFAAIDARRASGASSGPDAELDAVR